MEKTLLHTGTFLTRDGRGIRVSFYKRGYALTFKSGQDVIRNFTNEGGELDLDTVFDYNGTLDVKMSSGKFEYDGDTTVTVTFNRGYEPRDFKIVVFLKEDEDCRQVIRVHQDATELTYDWSPETLEFNGYQVFRPVEITAKMEIGEDIWDEPVIYGFNDMEDDPVQPINRFIMEEFQDYPSPTIRTRLPEGGYRCVWWVGCSSNSSGTSIYGEATIGLDDAGGFAEYIPTIIQSKPKVIEARMNIDDEGDFQPVLYVHSGEHNGYIGWMFEGSEFETNPTVDVETVDIGFGSDWVHLEPREEGSMEQINQFTVDDLPAGTERRVILIRVFNTEDRNQVAECMIIQNNWV